MRAGLLTLSLGLAACSVHVNQSFLEDTGTTGTRGTTGATGTTESFVQVSAGSSHTCGVTPAGDAVCWDYDHYGQTNPLF